jgi:hypothetical protein
MGWIHSPPYFTVATKTITDLANSATRAHVVAAPHRLEILATTPPPPIPLTVPPQHAMGPATTAVPCHFPRNVYQRPLATQYIYVDDFISLAQGNRQRRRTVRQILLHTLN